MKNIKPTYSLVSTLAIVAATTGLAHSAQASISYEDAGFQGICSTATAPLFDESVNTTPVPTEEACETKIATSTAYKLNKLASAQDISAWSVNLIEAEDFDRSDSIVCGATTGFTTPYPDCATHPGIVGSTKAAASLEYDLNVTHTGTYQIAFRYAAGNARPMDLTITPESGAAKTYSKLLNNTTGGWVEANQKWQLETQTIELTAGKNTLRLQTSANGGHNLPSLDAMTITKSDLDTCNEQGVIKKDSLRGSSCNPSETLWSTGPNLCITFYEHGGFGGAGYQYCSGRGTWSGTFNNDTFGSVAIDNGLSVTAWADYGQRGAANGWSTSQSNLGWLDDEISSVRANVPHISAMPAILTHDAAKKAAQDARQLDEETNGIHCADEGAVCKVSQARVVRYGAAGGYFYVTKSNDFTCSYREFGHPHAPSIPRTCTLMPIGAEKPADTPVDFIYYKEWIDKGLGGFAMNDMKVGQQIAVDADLIDAQCRNSQGLPFYNAQRDRCFGSRQLVAACTAFKGQYLHYKTIETCKAISIQANR